MEFDEDLLHRAYNDKYVRKIGVNQWQGNGNWSCLVGVALPLKLRLNLGANKKQPFAPKVYTASLLNACTQVRSLENRRL